MSVPRILPFLVLGLGFQWGCFAYDVSHLTLDTATVGFFEIVDSETGDTESDQTTDDTNSSTDTTDTDTADTDTADTDTADTDTVDTDTADTDTVDTDTVDTDTADTDTADTDTVDTDTADTDTVDTDTDTNVSLLEMETPLLSAGSDHTCAVSPSSAATCWGWNWRGQIGDGNGGSSGDHADAATTVTGLGSNVETVSAGGNHACAITTNSALQCWGYNYDGQLGDGTKSEDTSNIETTPVPVNNLSSGVVAVSVGGAHTCALLNDGGVMCWGENYEGQIGDGLGGTGADDVLVPTDVLGLASGVAGISSGASYSCALMAADGRVMCWGEDDAGQLGCGVTYTGDPQQPRPVFVENISGVQSISAGGSHTCAVLNPNGALKCWGWNVYGQLGLGSGNTDDQNVPPAVNTIDAGVLAVSAGDHHTCAVLDTGTVQCWGRNHEGQLGDDSVSPGLWDAQPIPVDVAGISDAVAVSTGLKHTCALLSTGDVTCWGSDNRGQVGNGVETNFDERFPSPSAVIGIP